MAAQRPTHIPLPPPRFPLDDIDPPFYTAPSTPDLSSPQIFYTPPTSPLFSPPALPTAADDPHSSVDLAFDLAISDDALSTLEKIYLFSRSKAVFHRVFIAHALPSFLDEVTPQEANEYVLPLLIGLALDDGELFLSYMRRLTLFQMSKSKKLWQLNCCLSSGGSLQ